MLTAPAATTATARVAPCLCLLARNLMSSAPTAQEILQADEEIAATPLSAVPEVADTGAAAATGGGAATTAATATGGGGEEEEDNDNEGSVEEGSAGEEYAHDSETEHNLELSNEIAMQSGFFIGAKFGGPGSVSRLEGCHQTNCRCICKAKPIYARVFL